MASKIILTRKGQFINRLQRFRVFIDGKETGLIKNDDTKEYELGYGTYTVQCKLNWMCSPVYTVNLKEGKNIYLKVSNGMKYYFPIYILFITGLVLPFILKIAKLPVGDWINILQIILIVPILLYLGLYLTIFRNSYLSLVEDENNPFS